MTLTDEQILRCARIGALSVAHRHGKRLHAIGVPKDQLIAAAWIALRRWPISDNARNAEAVAVFRARHAAIREINRESIHYTRYVAAGCSTVQIEDSVDDAVESSDRTLPAATWHATRKLRVGLPIKSRLWAYLFLVEGWGVADIVQHTTRPEWCTSEIAVLNCIRTVVKRCGLLHNQTEIER